VSIFASLDARFRGHDGSEIPARPDRRRCSTLTDRILARAEELDFIDVSKHGAKA